VTPSLDSRRRLRLDRLLANEVDMAFRRRVPILLDFLELRDGARVLDCGCGLGFYLKVMNELWDVDLVGLDTDASRLEWARGHGIQADLVLGDAQRLPFVDASFDAVLMTEVLEHLPDDGAALAEVLRVLRPGGVVAVSVPHANYPIAWDPINFVWTGLGGAPIRGGPIVGIWTNHERLYDAPALADRILSSGLELEILEESTHACFPLMHFLVYGIGKPLLEHGLVPTRLVSSADRFSGEQNTGSRLNPFNAVRSVFRLVDRLNDRPTSAGKHRFVNVLAKARKPAEAQADSR
jgi:SAM-dependent methyltransferase